MSTAFKRKSVLFCFTLLLITALLGGTVLAAPATPENAHDQRVLARIDADRALAHIRVLSEDIGPRVSGLDSEWQGAAYIAATLESYGYEVELESFPVSDQRIGTVTFPDGTAWQMQAASGGIMTGPDAVVTAEVVAVANSGLNASDWPADVAGKVALIRYNSTSRNTQVANAVSRGAAAVMLYNTVGGRGGKGGAFSPSISPSRNIPIVGAAQVHGEWMLDMLADGSVEVTIQTVHHRNLQSVNVLAKRPASNPKTRDTAPIVYYGAHLDSVVGAPGANDDASGVAAGLEIARVLQSYNLDKELRFGFWGSEERGLLGSAYHVRQLPPNVRSRIEAMFQGDMVASSWPRLNNLWMMTVNGRPNLVTDTMFAAESRQGGTALAQGTFGSSDHVSFHNIGVPSALFIWMRVDSWTPLVYELEPYYHTPEDTIEMNVSVERLQTYLDVTSAAIHDLVRKQVPARTVHQSPDADAAWVTLDAWEEWAPVTESEWLEFVAEREEWWETQHFGN